MSYSFTIRKPTKAEAIVAVGEELGKVIASQPMHDKDAGIAACTAMEQINILDDEGDRDVVVSCNGFLSWSEDHDGVKRITTANIGVTAQLRVREEKPALRETQVIGSDDVGSMPPGLDGVNHQLA